MKLSSNKLAKMRSGQTVYRVWANVDRETGGIKWQVNARVFLGRKVHGGPGYSMKMVKPESRRLSLDQIFSGSGHLVDYVNHIGDCHGLAVFTQRRQAERWIEECKAGLRPAVMARIIQHESDCLVLESLCARRREQPEYQVRLLKARPRGRSDLFMDLYLDSTIMPLEPTDYI